MKIAVILITYNHQKYIYAALEGLRNQSVQPDEVVIADDCSTDDTQNIIYEYVKKYSLENRWQLFFNPKNKGVNLNLQDAIDQTISEIIVPMSGDDISLPNRCEVALNLFAKHPNLHIVSTSIFKIDENSNKIGEIKYNDELFHDVKKIIIKGTPNVFPAGQNWKRSVFDKFGKLPINVPNEDDEITFRGIADHGIFCSSVKTLSYRIHQHSFSSWLRNDQSEQEYFRDFIKDMPIRGLHMKNWKNILIKLNHPEKSKLLELLSQKEELYQFLEVIEESNFISRIKFLFRVKKCLGLREFYYLLLGRFGVLSWRRVKKILRK